MTGSYFVKMSHENPRRGSYIWMKRITAQAQEIYKPLENYMFLGVYVQPHRFKFRYPRLCFKVIDLLLQDKLKDALAKIRMLEKYELITMYPSFRIDGDDVYMYPLAVPGFDPPIGEWRLYNIQEARSYCLLEPQHEFNTISEFRLENMEHSCSSGQSTSTQTCSRSQ